MFKFYNHRQIADLIKEITSHFMLTISQTENINEYLINTRLYPTDRYIEITEKGFENALYDFTQILMNYISDEYKERIEFILDKKNYMEKKFGNSAK